MDSHDNRHALPASLGVSPETRLTHCRESLRGLESSHLLRRVGIKKPQQGQNDHDFQYQNAGRQGIPDMRIHVQTMKSRVLCGIADLAKTLSNAVAWIALDRAAA
jgi:hypothetical protein